MEIESVLLHGSHVTLAPLSLDYLDALCAVGLDPDLWRITMTLIRNRDDMKKYIETALKWQDQKSALPFVTIEPSTGTVVGSTRFANIDHDNKRAEIGWTWIAPKWQRTAINTEAKFLMLRHAFETMRCIRVEFKTDSINDRSRNALLRIGAKEEGILRNHMITPSGRYRHSVYYSITDEEWPGVKQKLAEMVQRKYDNGKTAV